MSKTRNCPVCGVPLEVRDCRASFWGESAACRQCGAGLRFPLGMAGYALRTALMFGLAAAVFLPTRQLPEPWVVVTFLLLFTPAAVGVAALVQCFRWGFAAPVPLVEKPSVSTAVPKGVHDV